MSDSRDIHVNINTGTIIRFFVIIILLLALYYLSDVLLVIVAAIVIASALEPAVHKLQQFRIHRVISVVIVYLFAAAIFASILVFFLPMVISDFISFLNNLPSTISLESLWSPLSNVGTFSSATQALGEHTVSVSQFVQGLQSMFVGTGTSAFQTTAMFFGGVLSFILIVVLSFYLSVQENGVDDFLRIITPVKHHEYIIGLWQRSQRKIGYWLQGQVLLGIIIGVLVYLVLSIVGIPHPLVLAMLAAVLEIIPVFGPVLSAVPAVLIAFTDSGIGKGFLLIGLYLIIHQFENHLFYPLVVKKIVGVSPIVVILALVIGFKLAGVLGAILAVPLSAAFMEYIHDIEKSRRAERDAGKLAA